MSWLHCSLTADEGFERWRQERLTQMMFRTEMPTCKSGASEEAAHDHAGANLPYTQQFCVAPCTLKVQRFCPEQLTHIANYVNQMRQTQRSNCLNHAGSWYTGGFPNLWAQRIVKNRWNHWCGTGATRQDRVGFTHNRNKTNIKYWRPAILGWF